jgi:hypothetical protein
MSISGIGQFDFLNSQWKGVPYGSKRKVNQITQGIGTAGVSNGLRRFAELFRLSIPARFYPGPTVCHYHPQAVLSNRLSRGHSIAGRLATVAENAQAHQITAFHHGSESPSTAAKKGAFERLQHAIFSVANRVGLIESPSETSIDSTGLESHLVSRHFLMRQGKRTHRYRRWTKLTIVCEHRGHLIAGASVSVGPNNDAPWLIETVRQAADQIPIYRLLADSGYDSEENHRYCREELGIPSTVIAVNERRYAQGGQFTGHYRNQMKNRFPKNKFKQRWQVESVFSRFKRRLGYALRSHNDTTRQMECLFRVLTYNLMILFFLFSKSNIQRIH